MEVYGYHYLVVVNQFLGWPVVYKCNNEKIYGQVSVVVLHKLWDQ